MSKDEVIKQYMESLQISLEEATQLWEDDQEDYIGEDGEEMTAKAKSIKRYEQSAEPRKERKPREIKKDEEKLSIISELKIFLSELAEKTTLENVQVVNDQKEITFKIGTNEYSVTLTKHRPPKKGA